MAEATVLVFEHTSDGEKALRRLLEAGVEHRQVHVIGDLGPASSQPGAEHHVTFDTLNVPVGERALLMDTLRGGGVVLGVVGLPKRAPEFVRMAERAGALKVFATRAVAEKHSHNVAES